MVGSGTSMDVAREMGIQAFGLDLHSGFNVLRESILSAIGQPADLVVSHPPYGGMILYSGNVWGSPHPDDLSEVIYTNLDYAQYSCCHFQKTTAPNIRSRLHCAGERKKLTKFSTR